MVAGWQRGQLQAGAQENIQIPRRTVSKLTSNTPIVVVSLLACWKIADGYHYCNIRWENFGISVALPIALYIHVHVHRLAWAGNGMVSPHWLYQLKSLYNYITRKLRVCSFCDCSAKTITTCCLPPHCDCLFVGTLGGITYPMDTEFDGMSPEVLSWSRARA